MGSLGFSGCRPLMPATWLLYADGSKPMRRAYRDERDALDLGLIDLGGEG